MHGKVFKADMSCKRSLVSPVVSNFEIRNLALLMFLYYYKYKNRTHKMLTFIPYGPYGFICFFFNISLFCVSMQLSLLFISFKMRGYTSKLASCPDDFINYGNCGQSVLVIRAIFEFSYKI